MKFLFNVLFYYTFILLYRSGNYVVNVEFEKLLQYYWYYTVFNGLYSFVIKHFVNQM